MCRYQHIHDDLFPSGPPPSSKSPPKYKHGKFCCKMWCHNFVLQLHPLTPPRHKSPASEPLVFRPTRQPTGRQSTPRAEKLHRRLRGRHRHRRRRPFSRSKGGRRSSRPTSRSSCSCGTTVSASAVSLWPGWEPRRTTWRPSVPTSAKERRGCRGGWKNASPR